jgi:cytochrome c peroxidase
MVSCKKDDNSNPQQGPTPYTLAIPKGLPQMQIPADNPLTVEGIALGRRLFYDPILSGNQRMACGSCHNQNFAFTDSTLALSIGIDNLPGVRNSMPLFNLGYQRKFFWDGGAADLESQVIGPIQNPVEMHAVLGDVIGRLNAHSDYPSLFKQAFGTDKITSALLMKAIAQFERTMVSGNSKFDRYKRGETTLTAQEANGMALFEDEAKGDCNHCHSLGSTFSDFEFRNNGVDSIYADPGRYKITLLGSDSGKFKTPSLRNIALTAPYMHDGRFKTLQECLNHYNTGFHYSPTLDPVLASTVKGRMSNQDMADIVAFLNTLSDTEFTANPAFKKP